MRLIYGIIIIILFCIIITNYSTITIEFFSNYDTSAQNRMELIKQDNVIMETVTNAVDGTDSTLPTKIAECETVNLSDSYTKNRGIMTECSKSITPLFRGLRYTASKNTTPTTDPSDADD